MFEKSIKSRNNKTFQSIKKSLESWNVDKGKSLIKRYIMHTYNKGVQLFIQI